MFLLYDERNMNDEDKWNLMGAAIHGLARRN